MLSALRHSGSGSTDGLKKDNLAFLGGGFVLGLIVGIGVFSAYHGGGVARPAAQAPAQAGAPSGGAASAETALVAEVFRLKQLVQQDPANLPALTRLAHIHHDRHLWGEAAAYYEKAIELSPDDPDLLTDLGICYRGLGRFEDALAVFARARAADGNHWQSLYNSAVVLAFDLGQYDRAQEVLRPLLAMGSPPPQVAELYTGIEQARSAAQGSP